MAEYIYEHSQCYDMFGKLLDAPMLTQREEIVRCRDCEHVKHDPEWQPDRRFKPVDMWTCHAEWCEGFEGDHPVVEPDGFCRWGERRNE